MKSFIVSRILISLLALLTYIGVLGVGIIPLSYRFSYVWLVIFLVSGWFLMSLIKPKLATNLIILFMALGLTLIALDLATRIIFRDQLYYRPTEMFIHRWPTMPLVSRYQANVSYSGETYGDLAAMSGEKSLQEKRPIEFKTDAFGFRNNNFSDQNIYDVIILGDSFGVGIGTTQEATFASLLASRYGLRVYNLSMQGSPWQGYINLTTEFKRLKTHQGSVLLLTIFPGNDLDEIYGSREMTNLPWNDNWFERLRVSTITFRNRSPIQQLIFQARLSQSPETLTLYKDLVIRKQFINDQTILFYKPYVAWNAHSAQDIVQHNHYESFLSTLLDIKAFADDNCLSLKIVHIPDKSEIYRWVLEDAPAWSTEITPSAFSTILRDFSDRHEIEFLDLKPALVNTSQQVYEDTGDLLWWSDDTHWNPKGHDVVATTIFEKLLDKNQVPTLKCGR